MSGDYDDECRRAARLLLRKPLLTAEADGEDFRLVRRHARDLKRRFAEGLGYRLVVGPKVARLYKAGLGRDPSRPLLRAGDRPFEPRAYALLCLTMAALDRCRDQFLLDELVGEVRGAVAGADLDIDLDTLADRRAMYAALMALVGWGVLRESHHEGGGLERWVSDPRARSLLNVDRERLRLLPSASVAGMSSPADLLDVAALPSAAGGARVAIRRQLMESPVMTTSDLTEEQAEWWRRNRNREQERLAELFGVELELRAEGALVIDPDDELSDVTFPGKGAAKQFALLLIDRLVTWCVDAGASSPWHPVPAEVVTDELQALAREYHHYLNRTHRETPHSLYEDVLAVLTSVGLVRVAPPAEGGESEDPAGGSEGPTWLVHAAASRYRPEVIRLPFVQASLFDDAEEGD